MRSFIRYLLHRLPLVRRFVERSRSSMALVPPQNVSTNYEQLRQSEADYELHRLRDSWKSSDLPNRQRILVDTKLAEYRRGESVPVFDLLVRALRELPGLISDATVLEIGCSSGFYSEVLAIAGIEVCYSGCDYSDAFIAMARDKYPGLNFQVEDATELKYGDGAFDVVISGGCLLHIPNFQAAVAETARVTRRYAIFHRTPLVLGQPNVYYRKHAYGVETVEIHFNELEFLELLDAHDLEMIAAYTLDESVHHGKGTANRTFVCKKRSN